MMRKSNNAAQMGIANTRKQTLDKCSSRAFEMKAFAEEKADPCGAMQLPHLLHGTVSML